LKTIIYYFSATGNSLAIARSIAAGVGEAELVSIPAVIAGKIDVDAPKIGLVFPVYAWGLPRIVTDFIKKLKFDKNQYIFAVATCGGTPAGALIQAHKMLKQTGAGLNAGFVVREISGSLGMENAIIGFVRRIAGKLPQSGKERLSEIIAAVKKGQQHRLETSSWAANFLGSLFYEKGIHGFKEADRSFWVDEKCNLCRTCEKICPRQNIKIVNNKPTWHHDCELCMACIHWCPNEAIQLQNGSSGKKRYHHPEVTIKEMILR
jgi:flavodoxin/ferredoxin